jgi:ABC-2 type transport system permease protein
LGLSLVAIIASPAFGYAGVGMPVLAMNAFAQSWGALLPIRWYQQLLFDQAASGSPVRASAPAFAILAGMALGLFVLTLWRLNRLSSEFQREEDAPLPLDGCGIAGVFVGEWRRVLADRGVFSLLVVARFFTGCSIRSPISASSSARSR